MRAAARISVLITLLASVLFAQNEHGLSRLDFRQLPDLPDSLGFGGPIVGTHNNALIVAGGANFPVSLSQGGDKVWHDDIFVLLPGEEKWRLGQKLSRPVAYAASTSVARGIVLVGGSDEEAVYPEVRLMGWDPASQRIYFEDLPDLPAPSAFGSAEAIGNVVYVLGGKQSKDEADLSGRYWRLDLDAPVPEWEPLSPYPGPARYKMVTAVQRGPEAELCLFMFSGSRTTRSAQGGPLFEMFTDAFRFCPLRNAWTKIADLPVLEDPREIDGKGRFADDSWPINAASAAAYDARTILTFGGSTGRYILDEKGEIVPPADRPDFLNRVLAYDTLADTWTDAGAMLLGVVTTRTTVWNGRIVIPSGEVRPGIRTPIVQALSLPEAAPDSGSSSSAAFNILDYAVLCAYLALMVGVGVYFARRETSTEEFFLAGRKIPWWAAGLSIFGTQLSAITFMAIPATAYGSDWRRFVGHITLLPIFVVVIFCFLPFFRRLDITTAYEYLEARFSLLLRLAGSVLFILFQLGRMAIVVLLPAIALSAVTGINVYLCITLMGILATVYTTLGGISAVIWTDVLQVIVLIGGAVLCFVTAISSVGGFGVAVDIADSAGKLHMLDWRWSLSDLVAWVLIVGFLFTNLVPYTTDQTVIQRYLTTRDEKQAARSLWLNLVITIPTGLLFYGLGTALFAYYEVHVVARAMLPDQADQLVPWFVVTHLPSGVAGLVIAGVFAAAMSSLDSSMNSISTVVVNDFVRRLRTNGEPGNSMQLARWLTGGLGAVGTVSAMLLAAYEFRFLFDFFQKIIGLFGGSLSGVFVLAVFTRRSNEIGAAVGLLAGAAATLYAAFATDLNFLLYAVTGCVVCLTVGYAVSLATGGCDRDLSGLTLWTRRRVFP